MHYVFQFGVVWDNRQDLIDGALATVWMSLAAFAFGLVVAMLCTFAAGSRWRALRVVVRAYVEVIRNTPLLVQLFILYFSLAPLGLRLDADEAAVFGLGINFGSDSFPLLFRGALAWCSSKGRPWRRGLDLHH